VPVPPATVPEPMPEPELRRLLVVDDEEFIRYVTVLAFEGQCAGCQVVEAENGEEGIAVFLAQRQESRCHCRSTYHCSCSRTAPIPLTKHSW